MAPAAFPTFVGCVAGVVGLFVSGFLAAPIMHGGCSFGGGWCVGCVVRGCCLRTT
jgi:hypothetical protein